MKTYHECIPCFTHQALDAAQAQQLSRTETEALLRKTLNHVAAIDWNRPPPLTGRDIQNFLKTICGKVDPYLQQKRAHSKTALTLLPKIEQHIEAASDPFVEMIRFSIAGNAIDLGTQTTISANVENTFRDAFKARLPIEQINALRSEIDSASSVLLLTDNCGEVVFDRPLMEYIGEKKLIIGMRGSPTINDATVDDAKLAEIPNKFRIISNGNDIPGTWIPECSDSFVNIFNTTDVVIAKGQGNYETLSDTSRSIYHLLLVKCSVLAKDANKPVGTYIVHRSDSAKENTAT